MDKCAICIHSGEHGGKINVPYCGLTAFALFFYVKSQEPKMEASWTKPVALEAASIITLDHYVEINESSKADSRSPTSCSVAHNRHLGHYLVLL